VTWTAVAVLAAGTLALKAVGPLVTGRRLLSGSVAGAVAMLPPALLAALVALQTLGDGRALTVDARLPAVAVAALAVWKGASLLTVVVLATVTAALLRLAGLP